MRVFHSLKVRSKYVFGFYCLQIMSFMSIFKHLNNRYSIAKKYKMKTLK